MDVTTPKDSVFLNPNQWGPSSFKFDKRVADVFDDMVERSVPGYEAIQLLLADMAVRLGEGAPVYDLGCSTGTTLNCIAKRAGEKSLTLVGYDQSPDMVSLSEEKLRAFSSHHSIKLAQKDILTDELFNGEEAGVVILSLVLQFVRPMRRAVLLKKIYESLRHGGCLLLVEKTICTDEDLNRFFVDYYHSYKAEMGYSQLEISSKREALENVLIPFTQAENIQLLKDAGFKVVEPFFQWINFSGFVAIKK